MADIQLVINAEEQEYLVRLLENALKGDRVEEHRTDRRAYRESVRDEISLVEALLAKLGHVSTGAATAAPARPTIPL